MPSEELTGILGYEWIDGNLPATFVIKPDGTLQNVWFVTVTKADLEKSVEKAKGTLKP
jgi:peroxiredoxin